MSDIGKIMAVASAIGGSGGGSGGSLVVPTFTDLDDTVECDMQFSQISAAVASGQCFYAKVNAYDGQTIAWLYFVSENVIAFSSTSVVGDGEGVVTTYATCSTENESRIGQLIYPPE